MRRRISECENAAAWDIFWEHIFIFKPECSIFGCKGFKYVFIGTVNRYNAGGD